METLNLQNVVKYVEENIGNFHQRRLDTVKTLRLKEILKTKNPYLFKAKNVNDANEIIKDILNAYISSSEEGVFGNWLERLAIFINDSVYHGRKAGVSGIDLDFDRDGKRYLVAIKSGPNWANGSQIEKLIDQFNTARKRLSTSGSLINVVCVNGCCYGKTRERYEYKSNGNYYKFCGQRFWELISGEKNLYTDLIIPVGHEADIKNEEFKLHYENLVNRLSRDFLIDFCNADGSINWNKLIVFNSEFIPNKPKQSKKIKR